MATIIETVEEQIEKFNESIRKDMQSKNMDTTRNASTSLSVIRRGDIIVSSGINYIEYLDRGRPPGKFPPMDVIEKWVDLKGLNVDPFVIARNIAKNGTRIYRNRELGLKLEDKTKVLSDNLNEILPNFIANQIKTAFNNALKGR